MVCLPDYSLSLENFNKLILLKEHQILPGLVLSFLHTTEIAKYFF